MSKRIEKSATTAASVHVHEVRQISLGGSGKGHALVFSAASPSGRINFGDKRITSPIRRVRFKGDDSYPGTGHYEVETHSGSLYQAKIPKKMVSQAVSEARGFGRSYDWGGEVPGREAGAAAKQPARLQKTIDLAAIDAMKQQSFAIQRGLQKAGHEFATKVSPHEHVIHVTSMAGGQATARRVRENFSHGGYRQSRNPSTPEIMYHPDGVIAQVSDAPKGGGVIIKLRGQERFDSPVVAKDVKEKDKVSQSVLNPRQPLAKAMPSEEHHLEVVPAKSYYGSHSVGAVVLHKGRPIFHGSGREAKKFAEDMKTRFAAEPQPVVKAIEIGERSFGSVERLEKGYRHRGFTYSEGNPNAKIHKILTDAGAEHDGSTFARARWPYVDHYVQHNYKHSDPKVVAKLLTDALHGHEGKDSWDVRTGDYDHGEDGRQMNVPARLVAHHDYSRKGYGNTSRPYSRRHFITIDQSDAGVAKAMRPGEESTELPALVKGRGWNPPKYWRKSRAATSGSGLEWSHKWVQLSRASNAESLDTKVHRAKADHGTYYINSGPTHIAKYPGGATHKVFYEPADGGPDATVGYGGSLEEVKSQADAHHAAKSEGTTKKAIELGENLKKKIFYSFKVGQRVQTRDPADSRKGTVTHVIDVDMGRRYKKVSGPHVSVKWDGDDGEWRHPAHMLEPVTAGPGRVVKAIELEGGIQKAPKQLLTFNKVAFAEGQPWYKDTAYPNPTRYKATSANGATYSITETGEKNEGKGAVGYKWDVHAYDAGVAQTLRNSQFVGRVSTYKQAERKANEHTATKQYAMTKAIESHEKLEKGMRVINGKHGSGLAWEDQPDGSLVAVADHGTYAMRPSGDEGEVSLSYVGKNGKTATLTSGFPAAHADLIAKEHNGMKRGVKYYKSGKPYGDRSRSYWKEEDPKGPVVKAIEIGERLEKARTSPEDVDGLDREYSRETGIMSYYADHGAYHRKAKPSFGGRPVGSQRHVIWYHPHGGERRTIGTASDGANALRIIRDHHERAKSGQDS